MRKCDQTNYQQLNIRNQSIEQESSNSSKYKMNAQLNLKKKIESLT